MQITSFAFMLVACEHWQHDTYPAIARHARKENADIFFWEESGFRADSVHGRHALKRRPTAKRILQRSTTQQNYSLIYDRLVIIDISIYSYKLSQVGTVMVHTPNLHTLNRPMAGAPIAELGAPAILQRLGLEREDAEEVAQCPVQAAELENKASRPVSKVASDVQHTARAHGSSTTVRHVARTVHQKPHPKADQLCLREDRK